MYAYLADFTRHPEWAQNLQRVQQVSGGPVRVGTIFQAQEGPAWVRILPPTLKY